MKKQSKISEFHLHRDQPTKRQFEIFDLMSYLEQNKEHSSKPHSHSFYQLIWFKNNVGKHFVDFQSFEITKDRLFFIAKNQIHYFEKSINYEGVLLHFNESFLLQNERDIEFFINYELFNNPETPYYQIPRSIEITLNIYIEQIKNEIDKVYSFGHESILSNTLKSLLTTIERERRKVLPKEISNTKLLPYQRFRKLLEIAYIKNWSVATYAQKLNISTKTLNNSVKSKTGRTTLQLINDRVILEAKRKLSHSTAFVNEIGFDLGFEDPSYFVKFFKKHVHLTPSEFRKSIS